MIKTLLCVTLALALCTPATPQNNGPDDDVVRISTNLIQLDVSVVDRHGKTITDLKRDEIEILENGKVRDLENFVFVSRSGSGPNSTGNANGETTGFVASTPSRRFFVLVIDDLALSFDSTRRVRRALMEFIDEQMAVGDVVAFVKTGRGGVVQQFTTNKNLLRAAVADVRWNPRSSNSFRTNEAGIEGSVEEQELGESLATASLTAVNNIVKSLATFSGRKSLIFFSDGFSLLKQSKSGFQDASRVGYAIQRIADSAYRSSAVVYAVDARGLETGVLTASDPVKGFQRTGAIDLVRRQAIIENQEGLRFLARETGGFAIINTNDISSGVGRILEQEGYYLIAYEPDAETFDSTNSRFNKLEIRIKRPGVIAQYRSGFFSYASDERRAIRK